MSRPPKKIDKEQFEKLCAIQCTLEEMEGFLGVSGDTIERWCVKEYGKNFAEVFRLKRGLGKVSLRRSQFRLAETNPTMAIWLGKQYLGQTDEQKITVNSIDDSIKQMEAYFDHKKAGDGTAVDKPD